MGNQPGGITPGNDVASIYLNQQQTFTGIKAGESATVTFVRFDSTLGYLRSVSVSIAGTLTGTARLENLGGAAAQTKFGVAGTLSVALPSGYILETAQTGTTTTDTTVTLGAYDGSTDFDGPSGVTAVSQAYGYSELDFANFAGHPAFQGPGTVDLTVTATTSSHLSGAANLLTEVLTAGAGRVDIVYEYEPYATTIGISTWGGAVFDYSIANLNFTVSGGQFAHAVTSASQVFTLDPALSGWTRPIAIDRFDPTLGTLLRINVGITAAVDATLSVENLGVGPTSITLDDSAKFTIDALGTEVLSFTPGSWITGPYQPYTAAVLNGFDGTRDFAGTSGAVIASPHAYTGATHTQQIYDAALLAAFTGYGTETMSVSTLGNVDIGGGGDLLTQFLQNTGATVEISYVYNPFDAPVEVFFTAACFAQGTNIATTDGPITVESLHPGQTVVLADGGTAPIAWIGHRAIDCARHPDPASVHPIRVSRGAFARGIPARDLYLSPDHAIFTDGVLIPIRYLTNGTTIRPVTVEQVTYFHVELPRHAALLAEDLPAESYLDTGDRASFANGGPVIQAHPRFGAARREADGFAPLVVTGPTLDRVRTRLAARVPKRMRVTA